VGYVVLLWERRMFKRHVADGSVQVEPEAPDAGAAAAEGADEQSAPSDEGAPA